MPSTNEYQASVTDPHAFVAIEGSASDPDYQWVCAHLLADLICEVRELRREIRGDPNPADFGIVTTAELRDEDRK